MGRPTCSNFYSSQVECGKKVKNMEDLREMFIELLIEEKKRKWKANKFDDALKAIIFFIGIFFIFWIYLSNLIAGILLSERTSQNL